jgi:hypothetical protein
VYSIRTKSARPSEESNGSTEVIKPRLFRIVREHPGSRVLGRISCGHEVSTSSLARLLHCRIGSGQKRRAPGQPRFDCRCGDFLLWANQPEIDISIQNIRKECRISCFGKPLPCLPDGLCDRNSRSKIHRNQGVNLWQIAPRLHLIWAKGHRRNLPRLVPKPQVQSQLQRQIVPLLRRGHMS